MPCLSYWFVLFILFPDSIQLALFVTLYGIHNHELVAAHGSYTPLVCWALCIRGTMV